MSRKEKYRRQDRKYDFYYDGDIKGKTKKSIKNLEYRRQKNINIVDDEDETPLIDFSNIKDDFDE